jgi:hypothetical protein
VAMHNDELTHREIMNCMNEGDIINVGGILYKVGHKVENM